MFLIAEAKKAGAIAQPTLHPNKQHTEVRVQIYDIIET
jgi:hypothetical protein